MAKLGISTGTSPNSGTGDSLITGATKINSNFNELYTLLGDGTTLTSGIVTSIVAGNNITVSGSTGRVTINAASPKNWETTSVGIHTLSNVGIGTTNPTSRLTVTGNGLFTGVVTATSFRGSGSNLTGIVTGITAGANITVLQSPSGNFIITATAATGVAGTWTATTAGIHTLSNVGIGTTNPTSRLTVTGNGLFTGVVTATTFLGSLTGNATSATYATTAGVSTYSTSAGIATYATTAGVSTYSTSAGIATYSTSAGIATYATIAGVSTSVIGGISSVTQLSVSGISTLGNVVVGGATTQLVVNGDARVTGILTVGTASITLNGITDTLTVPNLVVTNSTTGVTVSGVGVTVRDGGGDLGVAEVIDFGNNLTVSFASGIATITGAAGGTNVSISDTAPGSPTAGDLWYSSLIGRGFIYYNDGSSSQWVDFAPMGAGATVFSTGGGESYWTSTAVGIHTLSNVGIGTTNPTSALTVKGNTSLETLNVSGVSTFPINAAVGVDFVHQGGGIGKFRISGDGVYGNGRIGFYDSSNNLTAAWDSYPPNGKIDIYNYTNSGTQNITISAGSSVVLQHGGTNTKLQTLGAGVTVTGTTFTNQLVSSGVVTATSFSGSNTLKTRTIVSGATTAIVNNGIGNTNITGYKSYGLMKVGLSTAGWLRLYTDSTSRANDVSRSVGEDPASGSGVIAEVVTTGISTTQIISPFVMGGNLDDPADTTIYAAVTNLSGVTTSISVNLTLLQLEA